MRVQVKVTKANAEALGKLVGEELVEGTTLTVTSPKQQAGRPCACGCGEKTSGGTWAPGHDARHKSRLHKLVLGTDVQQRDLATAELTKRGWPLPVGRKATAPAPLPVPEA